MLLSRLSDDSWCDENSSLDACVNLIGRQRQETGRLVIVCSRVG